MWERVPKGITSKRKGIMGVFLRASSTAGDNERFSLGCCFEHRVLVQGQGLVWGAGGGMGCGSGGMCTLRASAQRQQLKI